MKSKVDSLKRILLQIEEAEHLLSQDDDFKLLIASQDWYKQKYAESAKVTGAYLFDLASAVEDCIEEVQR